MLQIQDLSFSYRKHHVFSDISLTLSSGNIYGLLGANGVGKSTLLYIICGLLTPRHGKVLFDGVDTRLRRPSTLEEIFIIPEEFSLPSISLDSYVKTNSKFYPHFSIDDLHHHLENFEMPYDVNLQSLSMGQKKKLFMSFALACNTRLVLMDEPTNGLDITSKSIFRKVIVSAMSDEKMILISTHQIRDIDKILDHVVIMGEAGILLNKGIYELSQEYSFTLEPQAPANALFTQPSIGGFSVIRKNDSHEETEVNIETLYQMVTTGMKAE